MLSVLLVGAALAADVTAGGGAEVVAGVVHAPGAWTGAAGGQVEGDLTVRGAVDFEAALDVRLGLPPVIGGIVPEVLRVRGDVGPIWLGAGIAPGPWRVEGVDGWDNSLVTWSVEQRYVLPDSTALVEVGIGSPDKGVAFVGGLDLGRGLDLAWDPGAQLVAAPLLVGVNGRIGGDGVVVNGGVFAHPDTPSVAGHAGAVLDFDGLRLALQAVGGWNTTFAAHIQADLFPDSVATPVARVELLGNAPGGAVGVVVRPVGWLDLKAEVAYADGAPQGWVGVAAWGETRARQKKQKSRR